ncbi:DUF4132 domain-containing protein [Glycomyces sp. NPDC047010]|uniref:DUF4132 domain-containing protein n=1 Tax=Glycomyces sp. NPDC047010 TaxID=3155023 RepID=UPI0033C61E3E
MTKSRAPQEDKLKLPASWNSRVLPRRGRPAKRPAVLADPKTLADLARERTEREADLRTALDLDGNAPYADRARAHLDGAPDPRGAAAVAALLTEPHQLYGASWLRPAFDAWVLDHGLPFACAAAVEFLAVKERTEMYDELPPLRERVLAETPAGNLEVLDRETDHGIGAVRALLAAASDDEYALAAAAVAARRDTPAKRIAATVLLPDEPAWLLEAGADFMRERENPYNDDLLWTCFATADQITAVGLDAAEHPRLGYDSLLTLVATLGADALPVLTGPAAAGYTDYHDRGDLAQAIAMLPSDDAAEHLLTRLRRHSTFKAATAAAATFPLRTLRTAARLAPGLDPADLHALAAIAALPDAALRARLTEDERTALDRLDTAAGRVPDADDLPPLLTNPPWTRKRPKADGPEDDPLAPSVKVPRPGKWFVPAALPQVLLKGRDRALPVGSVAHLATVLALAAPDRPYPGLAVAAETCDRDSLAAFGLALFEQWERAGGPAKDGWALMQLAHFPSDAAAVRLAELVRAWPGESKHKRAAAGVGVLGAMGTEAALRGLHGLAEKLKFKSLKDDAGRQLSAVAKRLGLSREQLADRLVPDLGLGAPIVLDYGPRSFTVEADEHLDLRVTDGTGKVLKALPKPGAKDDAATAGESYRRFGALKKDLRTTATDQVRRLEAAMATARTWPKAEFEEHIAGHPLNRRLAGRLVWWTGTGGTARGFRIAEDGTYSDADDAAVVLPEDAAVRLAHPVLLGDLTPRWTELLADYEILQPFDQLGRPVLALTDEERATGRLSRAEGAVIEALRVLGAAGQGWRRARPEDGGVEPGVSWSPGGGLVVAVGLEPGIWAGAAAESPEQTVRSVVVSRGEPCWRYDGHRPPRPVDLDPVTASEILARLERLTTSGGGPAA